MTAKDLQRCRLYGIVDLGYVQDNNVVQTTEKLIEGGIDILQLRGKGRSEADIITLGKVIHAVTSRSNIPLVVNDHPHAAAAVGAEGIHVGQDDDAVAKARAIVGCSCFVGKSTHSLAQAVAAQAEGADYIGFGPLYATGTKPDYVPIGLNDITEVHRLVSLPIFCIGGVNAQRLDEIKQAGARCVVVVSAFLQATDIAGEVRSLKARLLL